MIVITFLLILVTFLLARYKNYVKKYRDIENLPGPSTLEIINFYRQKSCDGIVGYLRTLNAKYGPVVKIWIKPFKPVIITTDMEFVDSIYKSNEQFYTPSFSEVETVLRNGIATTKSREIWKSDKQVITKALTFTYISNRLAIYNKKYSEFVKFIHENLGKPINIETVLERIFAETMIESLNDPQVNITRQEINTFFENRLKYMGLVLEKMNSSNMLGILHIFTKNYKLSLEVAANLIRIVEELFRRHKNIPRHLREKNNLIYAMIDSGMPDERIVDNMNTLISGGFDTSVLPLSLMLHELGKQPELQQKILEETFVIVGRNATQEITLNDLNDMTYLNCVIKESVRLFFPLPFVDRLLNEDTKIRNITIPKDTRIIFHLSGVLKLEENFQNANVFDPERFLPENLDVQTKKAFLSFGFGLKSCPGKNLAYAAMKFFIAKIVRDFEICSAGDDHEIQLKADIVFRSANGIPVVFRKRESENRE